MKNQPKKKAPVARPSHVTVAGEVLEVDIRQRRFKLWLNKTTSVTVSFSPEHEGEVTEALRHHRKLWLEIFGRAEYTASGKLSGIIEIERMQLHPVASIAYDATARPIEDVLTEMAREVPKQEWKKLPADLTDNLDHYIYGTRKR